ncbi:MAG: histidine kinase [Massilia sp.]|nr:histidine kinase [Massilia sp.]
MLGEVRRIAHDLRPAILDDLGLAAALDHLAREATRHGAAPVHFAADGDSTGLPGAVNTALFRIAQEALANSERHAGARRIDLTLARCKGGKGGNDSNDSMVLTIATTAKASTPQASPAIRSAGLDCAA